MSLDPIEVSVLLGVLHGPDPGLVQRDVAQRLPFRGETELILSLALSFRHDVPLSAHNGTLGQCHPRLDDKGRLGLALNNSDGPPSRLHPLTAMYVALVAPWPWPGAMGPTSAGSILAGCFDGGWTPQ